MNGPVLICGCPGSGTSLVTKMLRYAGMFVGSDAGSVEARKFHESRCFRDANKSFLSETIGFPHAPKGVRQFAEHVSGSQIQLEQLVQMIDKKELLKTYWGEHPIADIWGWKDPRNSATAIIWRKIFPDLRVLTINRKWRRGSRRQHGGSQAGEWFRNRSSQKIREMYIHPPGIDGLELHSVDYAQLLTHSTELRTLLQWVGLPIDPVREFENFLVRVGVESHNAV